MNSIVIHDLGYYFHMDEFVRNMIQDTVDYYRHRGIQVDVILDVCGLQFHKKVFAGGLVRILPLDMLEYYFHVGIHLHLRYQYHLLPGVLFHMILNISENYAHRKAYNSVLVHAKNLDILHYHLLLGMAIRIIQLVMSK